MSLLVSATAYAGTWRSDTTGWWYDNGNGTYPASSWQWIDGNGDGTAESYYFDQYGYCLMNTTTPDGYVVNADGAWTLNGSVQTKNTGSAPAQAAVDLSNPKAKLEDMNFERSTYGGFGDGYFSWDYERSGDNWKGALNLNVGNGQEWGNYDYYLGGQYQTLTFKAVPRTEWFATDIVDDFYVYNQETGEELFHKKRITSETNVFTGTVDVSGVQYLRIEAVNQRGKNSGSGGGFGEILVKDCYLY